MPSIDLTPRLVVTIHTPGGDVPLVADASNPGGAGGTVTMLGVTMPYDVAVVFGMPDAAAPGTLYGNVQQGIASMQPYVILGAVVLGAFLLGRR